jgi:hypothetical protein
MRRIGFDIPIMPMWLYDSYSHLRQILSFSLAFRNDIKRTMDIIPRLSHQERWRI